MDWLAQFYLYNKNMTYEAICGMCGKHFTKREEVDGFRKQLGVEEEKLNMAGTMFLTDKCPKCIDDTKLLAKKIDHDLARQRANRPPRQRIPEPLDGYIRNDLARDVRKTFY